MKKIFQLLLLFSFYSFNNCKTDTSIVNAPDFDESKQAQNLKYTDPRAKSLVEIVKTVYTEGIVFTTFLKSAFLNIKSPPQKIKICPQLLGGNSSKCTSFICVIFSLDS